MLQRRGACTGIDVGTHAVKLVRLEDKGGKTVCTHWGRQPIGQGNLQIAGAQSLKALLKELRLSPRKLGFVAAAVGGSDAVVRQASLDGLSSEQISNSVRFEARKHLPMENMKDPVLDYQVLDAQTISAASGRESVNPVLLAAAPRKSKQSLLDTLQRAGIDPDVLDIHPLPAVNAALHSEGGEHPDMAIGLLDLGTTSRCFAVTYPGGELYTRHLDLENEGDAGLAADGPVQGLVRQLSDTLRFLNVRNRKFRVETIRLCGGGATTPGLDAKLTESLGVGVLALDPFEGMSFDKEAPTPGDRCSYAAAVGLALRGDDVPD